MVDPKTARTIATCLSVVTLVSAIVANASTSFIVDKGEIDVEGQTVSATLEVGIWNIKTTASGNGESVEETQENKCEFNDVTGDANPGCDSACCKSQTGRCKGLKAMAIFAVLSSAVTFAAVIKMPMIAIAGAALNALSNLVIFSIGTTQLTGDGTSTSASCGLKTDGSTVSGGAAYALAIIACLCAFVQMGLIYSASTKGAYEAV
eukprot:m.162348 g.162348  ORF g.162348 m.162348 type:complete len:206 (-) comp12178_c0_seq1:207-824(-)